MSYDSDDDHDVGHMHVEPFYEHNHVYIHWPDVAGGEGELLWWVSIPDRWETAGFAYWCFPKFASDPHMPFDHITSQHDLFLLREGVHMLRERDGLYNLDDHGVESDNHPLLLDRPLWKWLPPVVERQNPPEWEPWSWREMAQATGLIAKDRYASDTLRGFWNVDEYDSDVDGG